MTNEQEWSVPKVSTLTTPVQAPAQQQVAPPPVTAPVADTGAPFFPAGTKAPSASGGQWWSPADHEGELHLFLGNTGPVSVETQWGERQAATSRAVVAFVQNAEPVVYQNQEIIQSVLSKQLSAQANVLGRLTKGVTGKQGRAAPWLLGDPSNADVEFANRWLAANAEQRDGQVFLHYESSPPGTAEEVDF